MEPTDEPVAVLGIGAMGHGIAISAEQVCSRVAPLFDALGQRTIWVSPVGAGTRPKLVNNTLVASATETSPW
jgi:hypothetical protein